MAGGGLSKESISEGKGTRETMRNGEENGSKERNIVRAFLSLSPEKGIEELWSLPLLYFGNDTLDTDPEEGERDTYEKREDQKKDNGGKERSAVQSSISFSLENETSLSLFYI